MSNRVLKKLYGDGSDLSKIGAKNSQPSGSDSDSLSNFGNSRSADGPTVGRTAGRKLAVNRFELLNNFEHNSMSDTEAKEDDDKDNDEPTASAKGSSVDALPDRSRLEKQDSTHSTDSLKKKKKKKKKVRSQKSLEGELDDLEAAVDEVNKMLGNAAPVPVVAGNSGEHAHHRRPEHHGRSSGHKRSVLHVENRHLNAENEMKRFFGSRAIQAEQSGGAARRRGRPSGRASISRSWVLVNPRNWQSVSKTGISMELVERGDTDDVYRFRIVHSKAYQAVQFQFLDAVESSNTDNLVAILNSHPYHIDTLVQFSDVCKMAEDSQMAAELVERALYCFEHVFHPLFSVTQGNCRLDYRRPENRALYLVLFKHLSFVGQHGCNRTALEFCKLILGLDPDGDPLSVLLMIDYYALRAEQYDYLVSLYDEWEASRNLSLLPNIRYSVSLALYFMSRSEPNLTERADRKIQEALIMFPSVLMALLDRCSVEPDAQVVSCDYFQSDAQRAPQAITQLVVLFVARCHMLWNDKEIMLWLERNVREVIHRLDAGDPFAAVCGERRKKYFSQGTPRNVLRHVVLSGIKEAALALPPDLTRTPIFAFDPLPPIDSIVSYARPVSAGPNEISDHGLFGVFLRSWLPDFNVDELAGRNRPPNAAVDRPMGGAAAAAGGAPVANRRDIGSNTSDLRRSVTSLLDAMRDLLSNIHMADIPHADEGDVDSDEEEDDVDHHR